jgi:excisionase family DNA binding protein
MLPIEDRLLTVRELADRLRVSLATAYAMVSNVEIVSLKIRGAIRIRESDLADYLDGARRQAACVEPAKPVRLQLKHLKLK